MDEKFQDGNILGIVDATGITPYLQGQDPRGRPRIMELTRIARANCKDGDCPTVYTTDQGTIAVQGYRLDHVTPDGEAIVEIPAELLSEAVRALGR